ncbi:ECF transporter S component [Romboutsia sedimentorum]|uniref:ECF transporter S component n=1 Tax=Romboutsia sedimentorum TaxID=1368474 RepID=A0ABT7EAL9_9FIRM|nr:CD3073 family putative ECF transporter S component [Romboutsia sedimentorum]MDK2563970.1 ECF transporter S component [Romboutsia sedimentorum]
MKTKILTFSAMCIVVNIVFGMFVDMLNIPFLFLDTVGTILGAVTLGPLWGALIGGCTNLVLGVITGPTNIPFALVNIVLGLVVGYVAKKKEFGYKEAVIVGIMLAVICPLVGTPISVLMFGGISGSGADLLVGFFMKTGQSIFTSAFIPRIISNIVDKPLSCIMVVFFLKSMPKGFIQGFRDSSKIKSLKGL